MAKLFIHLRFQHPFRKFFGYCNQENREMAKCLKEERLERRRRNYEESLKRKERFKQKSNN